MLEETVQRKMALMLNQGFWEPCPHLRAANCLKYKGLMESMLGVFAAEEGGSESDDEEEGWWWMH